MHGWATFWAGVIIVSLAAFTVLAVVVTIGGWRDLLALLKHDSKPENPDRKSLVD
jgi:hypothetical protein